MLFWVFSVEFYLISKAIRQDLLRTKLVSRNQIAAEPNRVFQSLIVLRLIVSGTSQALQNTFEPQLCPRSEQLASAKLLVTIPTSFWSLSRVERGMLQVGGNPAQNAFEAL